MKHSDLEDDAPYNIRGDDVDWPIICFFAVTAILAICATVIEVQKIKHGKTEQAPVSHQQPEEGDRVSR